MSKDLKVLSNGVQGDPLEDVAFLCKAAFDLNGRVISFEDIAETLVERGVEASEENIGKVFSLLPTDARGEA